MPIATISASASGVESGLLLDDADEVLLLLELETLLGLDEDELERLDAEDGELDDDRDDDDENRRDELLLRLLGLELLLSL